jgi:hypothetical protein
MLCNRREATSLTATVVCCLQEHALGQVDAKEAHASKRMAGSIADILKGSFMHRQQSMDTGETDCRLSAEVVRVHTAQH